MQINDVFQLGDFEDKIAAIAKVRDMMKKDVDSLLLTCLGIEKERMQRFDFDLNVHALKPALSDIAFNEKEHVVVRWYALIALIDLGEKTDEVANLLIDLADYYMEVTRENPECGDSMHAVIGEEEIRRKTVEALGYFEGNEGVADALIKAAKYELFVGYQNITSPYIYAVRALGKVGSSKAVEYLKYLAPVSEGEAKQEAQEALAKLGFSCATCRKPLTYIPQYQRWYCYNCKKYAPKDIG